MIGDLVTSPDFLAGLGLAMGLAVLGLGYQLGAYGAERRELRRISAELGKAIRLADAGGARRRARDLSA